MMSLLVTPLRYTPCGQRQADWSSAFVKTEGIQFHEKGRDGACLGIRGTFQKSDPLPTDSDWTLVVFEFDSQDRREVEIGPHLGWHGSIVHGRCFG
jgi:hypothetical protein